MKFMVFTDKMIDGVASIDHQHAQLVHIINELYALMLKRDGAVPLATVFDELAHYTAEHFAHEEKLMAETGYPKLEEHRAEHEVLNRRIAEYHDTACDGDDTILAAELLHFLKQWLTDHIPNDDRDACRHMNAHGIR
jgi:hemerythrin-like metal-binding protein